MAQPRPFILNAPLTTVMWQLSWPAILAMVLYGLNAFMDVVFVGQLLDASALAAVSIAYPLSTLTLSFGALIGTGGAAVLSIAIGEEDRDTQEALIAQVNTWSLVFGAACTSLGLLFARPLLASMGATGAILDDAVLYFQITSIGAVFWIHGLALNFVVRGEGKMKTAAALMSVGLLLNLILTPVLIVYGGMGVDGAAWASNAGMLTYSIVGLRYFAKGHSTFAAAPFSLGWAPALTRKILTTGLPGLIVAVMGVVQAFVVFNVVADFGERDLAVYAAASRIQLFLMTPLFGLMRALQPVVGINYGAGQIKRVREAFWVFTRAGLILIAPFWLFITAFPELTFRLALPELPLSADDLLHLRVFMLVLPGLPLVFMAITFFPAIGRPAFASIVGLARQVVFYIPVMLLLPLVIGIGGVYYGATAIDLVLVAVTGFYVVRTLRNLSPAKAAAPSA
ncbi:MAG: MATE family efflux transporter [Bacteroidota bacterium]